MVTPIAVRPATLSDVDAIARVHVDTWRSAYASLMPASVLDALSYEKRAAHARAVIDSKPAKGAWLVAESGDDGVVGFVCGGPCRASDDESAGELYALYVLASHERHGLGRRLVQAFVDTQIRDGFTRMKLWVLADNPACQFYEAVGGALTGEEKTGEFGGTRLREVAYAWSNLSRFGSP